MVTSNRSAKHGRLFFLICAAIWAVATLLLLLTPTSSGQFLWTRWLAIMLLAWCVPGALLVAHWRLPAIDLPTAAVLAGGLGLGWVVLILLLVHWWPGPLERWPMILVYAGGSLLLLLGLLWHKPLPLRPTGAATWAWVLALLALAALLRLPGLGYHEFHDDEVAVLTRAREAIRGMDDALERHTKGPGEFAVATVVYRTLDTVDEANARLPYGLTSVMSILALALVGRRLFSTSTGIWAGVLLAVNGFALGLSRIVQYQPMVLLLSALVVYSAWEFALGKPVRWLALSVLLSAFGVVMHYEFALLAPAVLLAVWYGWRIAADKQRVVFALAGSALAGLVLVVAAYVPGYLNPYFQRTQDYLGMRMGAFGQNFNLAFFVEMGTFYNSTYFFAGLLLLVIGGLAIGLRCHRQATLLLISWFLPYLLLYLFVVQFPGTHFYLLMPSWSLLAALPLAVLTASSRIRPLLRYSVVAVVTAWLAISIYYLYLMFFRQNPEYLINYRQERVSFYWAPYGEEIPAKPRFGFPLKEGWKALGVLAEWNYLTGTYASNERFRHLRWYLGGLERVPFDAGPDFIFLASHVQEPEPTFHEERLDGYHPIGEIRVHGEPRISIWSRQDLPGGYVTYDAEAFEELFTGIVPALHTWPESPAQVAGVALGEGMTIAQASVDRTQISPGDLLHVYLVWKPEAHLDRDYKVFVHLADGSGRPVAQWDGLPGLNTARTSQWQAGTTFKDHVLVAVPLETPPGEYTLRVGLYDPASGERLGNNAVDVATVTVR